MPEPASSATLSMLGKLRWPKPLFPYQVAGVQTLLSRPQVLLADEMGLGKTIQAIAAIRIAALQGTMSRVLVVVPAGLVFQWRREVRVWAPELALSTVVGTVEDRARAWARDAVLFLTT
jgi:SNF2 family DNA or RNA helicase